MPRKKISEFQAKTIVHKALGLQYVGYPINADLSLSKQLQSVQGDAFVVKVDQGVKGRFKKGLVLLNVTKSSLPKAINQLRAKEYQHLIVEPMIAHESADERYLGITQGRHGLSFIYSTSGGVDIEAHADSLHTEPIDEHTDWNRISRATELTETQLRILVEIFKQNYMVFLEINPYIVVPGSIHLLDLAVEVDDAGAYFVHSWNEADFRSPSMHQLAPEEQTIVKLKEKSPASFKLDIINPDGSIFLLLSGGGASILVADEVYNQGHGKQLANYGEYSGNPNTEETYIYASALLQLLLKSKARKKVLFIGGAVANFTDIANTFTGIIQALDKVAPHLRKQHVKVFIRRGGPRQEVGLAKIEAALKKEDLFGAVHGPDISITDAVDEMLKEVF